MGTMLSRYVPLSVATHSTTAIKHGVDNSFATEAHLSNAAFLAQSVIDPAVDAGLGMFINGFYRSPALGRLFDKLGHAAANRGDHYKGLAVDVSGRSRKETNAIGLWFRNNLSAFDQLIFEGTEGGKNLPSWIHVSCRRKGNRRQVLYK